MKFPLSKLSDFPYNQTPQKLSSLVEIFDNRGEPFLLMPLDIAKKKKMSRRIVFIILKDHKNRVLLAKKMKNIKQTNTPWSLSAYTNVFAGESAEGAVVRELKESFNIDNIHLKELRTVPFLDNDDIPLSASIFLAGPWREAIKPNLDLVHDAMFVDKDELTGLLQHQPEMFHSLLGWALRSGWIF